MLLDFAEDPLAVETAVTPRQNGKTRSVEEGRAQTGTSVISGPSRI
jgi:hypothetical protein